MKLEFHVVVEIVERVPGESDVFKARLITIPDEGMGHPQTTYSFGWGIDHQRTPDVEDFLKKSLEAYLVECFNRYVVCGLGALTNIENFHSNEQIKQALKDFDVPLRALLPRDVRRHIEYRYLRERVCLAIERYYLEHRVWPLEKDVFRDIGFQSLSSFTRRLSEKGGLRFAEMRDLVKEKLNQKGVN